MPVYDADITIEIPENYKLAGLETIQSAISTHYGKESEPIGCTITVTLSDFDKLNRAARELGYNDINEADFTALVDNGTEQRIVKKPKINVFRER